MKPEPLGAYHFTFLHGARVRSGSNYLGSIMGCNPHIQLVPPGRTMYEFPLIEDLDAWAGAFAAFLDKYKGQKEQFEFQRFSPHLGNAWLTYLIDTFSLQPGHIFIKWSSVRNIDKFFDVFPESKLILLVRDGRDNVASSVKAALATRHHKTLVQKARTRLSHLLMRDFRAAARDWADAVRKIVRVDEELRKSPAASRYLLLRYEDVFQRPREMGARIFEFMGVRYDEAILDAVENADVVGSSFFSARGREDANKPNWRATPRTEAFQPLGRWKKWSAFQKNLFQRIAGKQLFAMSYETDPNWHLAAGAPPRRRGLVFATVSALALAGVAWGLVLHPMKLRAAQIKNCSHLAYCSQAVEQYAKTKGRYPESLPEALALAGSRAPAVPDPKRDVWGNELVYRTDGKTFVIASLGRDGEVDGPDPWELRTVPVDWQAEEQRCADFDADSVVVGGDRSRSCCKAD
jgi:Sulfotransferase family